MYIPISRIWEFQLLHIPANTGIISLSNFTHSNRCVSTWNCGFNLHFPMFSILPWVYLPSTYLLWWNVNSNTLLILVLAVHLLMTESWNFLIYSEFKFLSWYVICKYFLTVSGCLFIFLTVFSENTVLKLMKSNLPNFFLLGIVLLTLYVRSLCLIKHHKNILLWRQKYSSKVL